MLVNLLFMNIACHFLQRWNFLQMYNEVLAEVFCKSYFVKLKLRKRNGYQIALLISITATLVFQVHGCNSSKCDYLTSFVDFNSCHLDPLIKNIVNLKVTDHL